MYMYIYICRYRLRMAPHPLPVISSRNDGLGARSEVNLYNVQQNQVISSFRDGGDGDAQVFLCVDPWVQVVGALGGTMNQRKWWSVGVLRTSFSLQFFLGYDSHFCQNIKDSPKT